MYRLTIYPAGNAYQENRHAILVEADNYNLNLIIEAFNAKYEWKWESEWDCWDPSTYDFTTRVGTAKQWETGWLGTVVISKI